MIPFRRLINRCRREVSRILDPLLRTGYKTRYTLDRSLDTLALLDAPLITWLNYHQHEILGKQCYWLGHRALKNPMDAWIYQEIIYEVKPDIIVEMGNKNGGSTLFLASILQLLGHGEVLAIDVNHEGFTAFHPRIGLITGDCSDEEIIGQVKDKCRGKRVLVIHDAEHTRDAVLRDLRNYAPLVSPGSYFIVEDSIQGVPGFCPDSERLHGPFLLPDIDTPLQGIKTFLRENKDFYVDVSRERYILTANYRGFLRRITE